jgi:subtilisin family serine protease
MANPAIASPLPPDEPVAAATMRLLATEMPWGIAKIGAPETWALGYRGQGVVVAGQDTGYAWDHPALRRQYRGWDGTAANHDYNWHDAIHSGGGSCGVDSPVPCDDNGHGTHTMGTIVGDDDLGHQIGVAPEARWIGCRNMSQGVGTPATYAECFEFFMAPYPVGGTPAQGNPDLAPDVINNSWSCPLWEGCDAANIAFLEQVVENVRAAGILVVASAGNRGASGCGTVDQPAGMYDATFAVGATASNDTIAAFSSRGTGTGLLKPDISAPGVSVLSALPDGGYGTKSGTSMAAPHVVGAAALLWSARPDLRGEITATETLLASEAITLTSTQCGDAPDAVPNSVYGWGRIDIQRTVARALAATMVGVVRDAQGEGLTGANLRAERTDAQLWETVSGAGGFYVMAPLSGTYTVTVSSAHFTSQTLPNVVVSAGLTTTLNITLTRAHSLYLPGVFSP